MHHPLPGVGHNFQDHYIARMSCEVRGVETLNERGRGLSFVNELWRYARPGPGCRPTAPPCAPCLSTY